MSLTEMTLGHLRTGVDAGCAAAVARVLEAHDVEVAYLDLDADERAAALASGRVDLLVSAWMPRDQALAGPGMRVIGGLYKPCRVLAFTGGGTTGALSVDRAASLAPARILTTPDLAGWLSTLLERRALGDLDIPVEIVADHALFERVRGAIASAERLLVACEQPNAIFHDLELLVLDDPAQVLGGDMDARLILGARAAKACPTDLIDELDEMMLASRIMSALDHAITVDDMDPEDAAEAWQRGRLLPR